MINTICFLSFLAFMLLFVLIKIMCDNMILRSYLEESKKINKIEKDASIQVEKILKEGMQNIIDICKANIKMKDQIIDLQAKMIRVFSDRSLSEEGKHVRTIEIYAEMSTVLQGSFTSAE